MVELTTLPGRKEIIMTLREAKKMFINDCFSSYAEYRKCRKEDYFKTQLIWSYYMDMLCRNKDITLEQWNNATF